MQRAHGLIRMTFLPLMVLLLFASFLVPRTNAQSSALYFPATGHHLTDAYGFLSFWREHDGERLLGLPVTEAFESDGQIIQYFTKSRLETFVVPSTGVTEVRVGMVAAEYSVMLFREFPPAPKRRATTNELRFSSTKHTLRAPFLAFWQENGGEPIFGAPISEALWEQTPNGQRQVQYFERARLERVPKPADPSQSIVVSDLGLPLALMYGIDVSPVANWGAETAGPPPTRPAQTGPLVPPTPTPAPPTPVPPTPTPAPRQAPANSTPPAPRSQEQAATSEKYIVVNLTQQWLYAFENGKQVFDAPVATGRDGMNTPTGTFSVYYKLQKQTMRGVDNGVPWVVPNVPHVMYFVGGVALHGTYWHNLFGTGARPSHGCVNLPLDAAAWLYDWTPVGTTVRVTY
jgi:lipoprotein-anchoring transpeptidase ErfK/SrfK